MTTKTEVFSDLNSLLVIHQRQKSIRNISTRLALNYIHTINAILETQTGNELNLAYNRYEIYMLFECENEVNMNMYISFHWPEWWNAVYYLPSTMATHSILSLLFYFLLCIYPVIGVTHSAYWIRAFLSPEFYFLVRAKYCLYTFTEKSNGMEVFFGNPCPDCQWRPQLNILLTININTPLLMPDTGHTFWPCHVESFH
jgi:hypothetical protein